MPARRRLALAALIGGGRGDARRAVRDRQWPTRPVKLVVPFRPEAAPTRSAGCWRSNWPRIWARPSSSRTRRRQRQYRLGRGGREAEPDGYTLLLSGVGSNAINYALYASMPYRDSDFAHVAAGHRPNDAGGGAGFPGQDLRGLHPAGAREPDKYTHASSGSGSSGHLAGNAQAAGQDRSVHVPYKGGAAAITDLLGGRVTVLFITRTPCCRRCRPASCGRWRWPASSAIRRIPTRRRWRSPAIRASGRTGSACRPAGGRRPP